VAEPRLLPSGDAARAVGVSPRTLQRWVREGLIKPTERTAGGQYRWLVDDLREQIRALNQPGSNQG
jgi:DNA-binding transcriptional MerR regulator